MLKAPPVDPRTYISRYYIIDPTESQRAVNMFKNMFEKALKQVKRLTMPEKKGQQRCYAGVLLASPLGLPMFLIVNGINSSRHSCGALKKKIVSFGVCYLCAW